MRCASETIENTFPPFLLNSLLYKTFLAGGSRNIKEFKNVLNYVDYQGHPCLNTTLDPIAKQHRK